MLQHEFGLAKSTVKRGSTRAASGPWTGRGGTAAIPGISSFASSKPISAARATAGPSPSSTACATARRHETGRSGAEGEATTPPSSIRRDEGGRSPRARRRSIGGAPASRWRRGPQDERPPRRRPSRRQAEARDGEVAEAGISALRAPGVHRDAALRLLPPRGEPPSGRQAAERPAIAGICEKSRFRYGYRRVADTLRKAAGIRIADKTALKAVREGGCCSGPADAGGAASAWAGPAAPGARPQARARADGDRPVHVPQRKPPRQREGRELLLDGQDRALPRLGGTAPMSSRGIRRSMSTGMATRASRDAWTEAARSSAGSAGPLDSLLLPFRKRGPLQFWGAAQPRVPGLGTMKSLIFQTEIRKSEREAARRILM